MADSVATEVENGWSRRKFLKVSGGLLAARALCPPFKGTVDPSQTIPSELTGLRDDSSISIASDTSENAHQVCEEWANPLMPKGQRGPELTLASGGNTEYTIVWPAQPTDQDKWAAQELADHLHTMTGANFVSQSEVEHNPTDKAISVGRTQMLQSANLFESTLDLGEEGYVIAAQDEKLFLFGGGRRGSIYAVYALLEEDLNCRWYDASQPVIPFRPELTFRPVLRNSTPAFEYRDLFSSGYFSQGTSVFSSVFSPGWAVANRLNGWTTGIEGPQGGCITYVATLMIGTNHTLQSFVPWDTYHATHPDFFSGAWDAYQLCLSNCKVFEIVKSRVLDLIRANPAAPLNSVAPELISVGPADNLNYCMCEKCKAVNDAEHTQMGTLLPFVNQIAEAVENEFPDRNIRVSTLAYQKTLMPPKSNANLPRHNVVIFLCTDSHTWKRPFCSVEESGRFHKAMRLWVAKGATVFIWDYPTNYDHYLLPTPNMQVVSYNLSSFTAHHAKGVLLQIEGPGDTQNGNKKAPARENAPMRYWVWSKQLWDPSRDTRGLMHDFIYGYYREAAGPVWQYNCMLLHLWEELHKELHGPDTSENENPLMTGTNRFTPASPLFEKYFDADRALELFEQAEALAENQVVRDRVKLAKLSPLYVLLSQALGWYIHESYFPGTLQNTASPEQIVEVTKLLEEFRRIVEEAGITRLSDFKNPYALQTIEKWAQVLNQ